MSDHDPFDPTGTTLPAIFPTSSPALQEYLKRARVSVLEQLPKIRDQLKKAGVIRVRIKYDGVGDSGEIESVTLLTADGQPPYEPIDVSEDELVEAFYNLTQARHPGWCDGEGAWGEFDWDLTGGTPLQHVHHERFTDYNTTEHSGL